MSGIHYQPPSVFEWDNTILLYPTVSAPQDKINSPLREVYISFSSILGLPHHASNCEVSARKCKLVAFQGLTPQTKIFIQNPYSSPRKKTRINLFLPLLRARSSNDHAGSGPKFTFFKGAWPIFVRALLFFIYNGSILL